MNDEQFADAENDVSVTPLQGARAPDVNYIDEPQGEDLREFRDAETSSAGSGGSSVFEDEASDNDYYDEAILQDDDGDDDWLERELVEGMNQVMDQDWDTVSGDFTKKFNRLKQQVVATASNSQPRSMATKSVKATKATSAKTPTIRTAAQVVPPSNRNIREVTQEQKVAFANKVANQLTSFNHQFGERISFEPLFQTQNTATRKGGNAKVNHKDKSDRATNEQVLDPRTRLILFKMLNRGLIEHIDGCVSTGKEANVYHAVSPPDEDGNRLDIALKIFKTSILVFKDRERYVTGEFRFKTGYSRNPRKMVRLWAEKELRNLKRLFNEGLNVPEAIEVRENVLVMQFLGEDDWQASPRLKDAAIPDERIPSLYIEILVFLRIMFTRCRLVHADFSEYNILYHKDRPFIIDVSQSVEHDHKYAFDFLRSDIQNVINFFSRKGVDTLSLKMTFDFITNDSWTSEKETDSVIGDRIKYIMEHREEFTTKDGENDADDAVFTQSYIPRTLEDVYDPERDVERVISGEGDDLIYANLTGVASIRKNQTQPSPLATIQEDSSDDAESGSDSDSDSDSDEYTDKPLKGKKFEDKEEKKKRKQEVKDAKQEKRKTKMKKSVKKKMIKKGSRR